MTSLPQPVAADSIAELRISRVYGKGLGGYQATAPGLASGDLCPEELMGLVADWVYGHRRHGYYPQFLRPDWLQSMDRVHWGRATEADYAVIADRECPPSIAEKVREHYRAAARLGLGG